MANGSTFQTIMICHVLCARLKVACMVVQEGGDRYQVQMLMCILVSKKICVKIYLFLFVFCFDFY